jgi:hypothetical protein
VSHTYVIRAGTHGPVKIGTSSNPQQRLRQLQTASPRPLFLVGLVDETEAAMHLMLESQRLQGEWFAATPIVCDLLTEYGLSIEPTPTPITRPARVTWPDYLALVRMGLANEPSWRPEAAT